MLIRRTIRAPVTGVFQIAVRITLPSHGTSRGPPTLTDSSRPTAATGSALTRPPPGFAAPRRPRGDHGSARLSRPRRVERFKLEQWRRITGRGGGRGQAAGSGQPAGQAADEIDVPTHAALLWRW